MKGPTSKGAHVAVASQLLGQRYEQRSHPRPERGVHCPASNRGRQTIPARQPRPVGKTGARTRIVHPSSRVPKEGYCDAAWDAYAAWGMRPAHDMDGTENRPALQCQLICYPRSVSRTETPESSWIGTLAGRRLIHSALHIRGHGGDGVVDAILRHPLIRRVAGPGLDSDRS